MLWNSTLHSTDLMKLKSIHLYRQAPAQRSQMSKEVTNCHALDHGSSLSALQNGSKERNAWLVWVVSAFLLLHSQQHLQNPKHLGIAVQFPWGRNSLGENVIYYCCHFDANLWHYNTTNLLSIIRIFFSDYILIIFAFIIVNSSSMKVMFYLCPVVFRLISLLAQLFINCWMDFYRM